MGSAPDLIDHGICNEWKLIAFENQATGACPLANVLGDENRNGACFCAMKGRNMMDGLPEAQANLLENSDGDESEDYEISHQWRSPNLPSPECGGHVEKA
jgi:hypothetical protein